MICVEVEPRPSFPRLFLCLSDAFLCGGLRLHQFYKFVGVDFFGVSFRCGKCVFSRVAPKKYFQDFSVILFTLPPPHEPQPPPPPPKPPIPSFCSYFRCCRGGSKTWFLPQQFSRVTRGRCFCPGNFNFVVAQSPIVVLISPPSFLFGEECVFAEAICPFFSLFWAFGLFLFVGVCLFSWFFYKVLVFQTLRSKSSGFWSVILGCCGVNFRFQGLVLGAFNPFSMFPRFPGVFFGCLLLFWTRPPLSPPTRVLLLGFLR